MSFAAYTALANDMYLAGAPSPADDGREPLSVQDIIRRHHSALLSFLRLRLRISHDADDVAQESYIRLMQYEGSREIRSPSSMLFRIAINVANDLGRSELACRAFDKCSIDDVELVSELPSVEREMGACQDLELLLTVIAELSPKCQKVFLLSRVQLMTYPEIALHCGISLKMVEKHISRALAVCTKRIRDAAEPSLKPTRHERPRFEKKECGALAWTSTAFVDSSVA
jgi:RNA polymerase sigma factor (sigma-70 family)